MAAPSSELHLPAWLRARGGGTLIFGTVGVLAVALCGAALAYAALAIAHSSDRSMRGVAAGVALAVLVPLVGGLLPPSRPLDDPAPPTRTPPPARPACLYVLPDGDVD